MSNFLVDLATPFELSALLLLFAFDNFPVFWSWSLVTATDESFFFDAPDDEDDVDGFAFASFADAAAVVDCCC